MNEVPTSRRAVMRALIIAPSGIATTFAAPHVKRRITIGNDNDTNPDPSGTVGNMLRWMPFLSAEAFANHLHAHRAKVLSLPVADRVALGRAAAAFYATGAVE